MLTIDNAISFAASGNIVLALEIGSAYAIQVAMVQIPALVAFSAWLNYHTPYVVGNPLLSQKPQSRSEFTLVFPQWDLYTCVFSVFLRNFFTKCS